jgi:hypothetical protein
MLSIMIWTQDTSSFRTAEQNPKIRIAAPRLIDLGTQDVLKVGGTSDDVADLVARALQ